MQIPMVTHPLPTNTAAEADVSAKAPARAPVADAAETVKAARPMPNLWDNEVLRKLREVVREADPTLPPLVRAELSLDKATSRIVVRVVEIGSDEVVRQYPAEETLRLLARVREQLGPLLSATV
jgi:uncharacterized FlaG/YvyC family protein